MHAITNVKTGFRNKMFARGNHLIYRKNNIRFILFELQS